MQDKNVRERSNYGKMFIGGLTMVLISSICATGVLLYDSQQLNGPQGALTLSSNSWDFGSVNAKSELQHTFTLKNTSDATIDLIKAIGNCGCVALSPVKGVVLESGRTHELPIRWRVGTQLGRASVIMLVEYKRRERHGSRPTVIEHCIMKLTADVVSAQG